MLFPARVTSQLETGLDRFVEHADNERKAYRAFSNALNALQRLSNDELSARLAATGRPGALLSEEWDGASGLFEPFDVRFENHREAREWALEKIRSVLTIAVDGSEIKPTKDYSLPIGAVQVAWFENPHEPSGRYVKDVAFDVIYPDELTRDNLDGFGTSDQLLALRRFQGEVNHLIDRLEVAALRRGDGPPPVAFFDGSLVVSFAAMMLETTGTEYIQAICRLLAASERTRIPVVGFIDTSLAKDVATMLAGVAEFPLPHAVPDSNLLNPRLLWGDRTRALVCARDDVLGRYVAGVANDQRDYSREICFLYLKTNQNSAPARLDLPRWVVREGLLDHVVDVVRAEVIVGNGYPYCIETADACAVLGARDREHFYYLVQEFAASHGIGTNVVPKAASKRRRRA